MKMNSRSREEGGGIEDMLRRVDILCGSKIVNDKDAKMDISVRAKFIENEQLSLNNIFLTYLYSGIIVLLIPIIILVIGFVVWLRRRHL